MKSPAWSLPMKLLTRTEVGTDSWGQPVMDDVPTPATGYFYQLGTDDPDREGGVTTETIKVLTIPDRDADRPHSWDAVEFVVLGEPQRWEILGKPEPKLSLARGGKVHHWEFLATRGAA